MTFQRIILLSICKLSLLIVINACDYSNIHQQSFEAQVKFLILSNQLSFYLKAFVSRELPLNHVNRMGIDYNEDLFRNLVFFLQRI